MLLAAAGGVDHHHLVELAKKYFGKLERGSKDVLDYEAGKFSESYVGHLLPRSGSIEFLSAKHLQSLYGARVWRFNRRRNKLDA